MYPLVCNIAAQVGAAMVNAGAGLVNGLFNSFSQNKANKENIAFARESQQEQERFAKEMFNLENEWNLPLNQVRRLQEAGINPASMWSEGSGTTGTGSGDSAISPVSPNIQPIPSPITGMLQTSQAIADLLKTKAEISKLGGETKLIDSQIENLDWQSSLAELRTEEQRIRNRYLPQREQAEIKEIMERTNKTITEADKLFAEARYTEGLEIINDAIYAIKKQEYMYNETAYPRILNNLLKQGYALEAQANASNAAADASEAQASKSREEERTAKLANDLFEKVKGTKEESIKADLREQLKDIQSKEKTIQILQETLEIARTKKQWAVVREVSAVLSEVTSSGLNIAKTASKF